MDVKTKDLSAHQIYNILIGSILPRPIAWVSTINANGVPNLAPFSTFTFASSNPPVVCFAPAFKSREVDGKTIVVPKDTLKNIETTHDFVVNIVSLPIAEKMNQTSGNYPPGVDEFVKAGLTAVPSNEVRAPRVGEAMVSYECRLRQIINFGSHDGAGNLVLGDVVGFHFADGVYENNHIDLEKLQPIARLSGSSYCKVESIFDMVRPEIQ
jgi:flavin reductase (DIM6/NTAB) family NADH-FMN oxidoreductase RutF